MENTKIIRRPKAEVFICEEKPIIETKKLKKNRKTDKVK